MTANPARFPGSPARDFTSSSIVSDLSWLYWRALRFAPLFAWPCSGRKKAAYERGSACRAVLRDLSRNQRRCTHRPPAGRLRRTPQPSLSERPSRSQTRPLSPGQRLLCRTSPRLCQLRHRARPSLRPFFLASPRIPSPRARRVPSRGHPHHQSRRIRSVGRRARPFARRSSGGLLAHQPAPICRPPPRKAPSLHAASFLPSSPRLGGANLSSPAPAFLSHRARHSRTHARAGALASRRDRPAVVPHAARRGLRGIQSALPLSERRVAPLGLCRPRHSGKRRSPFGRNRTRLPPCRPS